MFLKIRKILKETLFILILALVLLSLVNVLLHFIPKSRTPIDITLNGDKIGIYSDAFYPSISSTLEPITLDVKDIEPVTIQGYYTEYFFREAELDVSISSIDGLSSFKPGQMYSGIGIVLDNGNQLRTTYVAERDGRPFTVNISFTEDFNNWLFTAQCWDAFYEYCREINYYGASNNENATTEYYEEVFAPLDFGKAFSLEGVQTVPAL